MSKGYGLFVIENVVQGGDEISYTRRFLEFEPGIEPNHTVLDAARFALTFEERLRSDGFTGDFVETIAPALKIAGTVVGNGKKPQGTHSYGDEKDEEPFVAIIYGRYIEEDQITFFVDVQNLGPELVTIRVEAILQVPSPRESMEEFKSENCSIEAVRGRQRHDLATLDAGPLPSGQTRRFIFPPQGIPDLRSVLESVPPENCSVVVRSESQAEVVLDGNALGGLIRFLFADDCS